MFFLLDKIQADNSPDFYDLYLYQCPYRNLLAAILDRAIRDYVGSDSRFSSLAESWLFFDKKSSPWSFSWLTRHLEIDPRFLRKKIKNLKNKQLTN